MYLLGFIGVGNMGGALHQLETGGAGGDQARIDLAHLGGSE